MDSKGPGIDNIWIERFWKSVKCNHIYLNPYDNGLALLEIIGEKTVADAIMDRLVHDAHRIELMGDSMRKARNKHEEDLMENAVRNISRKTIDLDQP